MMAVSDDRRRCIVLGNNRNSGNSSSNVIRSVSVKSLPDVNVDTDQRGKRTQMNDSQRREMMESLTVRKDVLEEALQKKLHELKELCLREAELTGILPVETPLAPREPVPQIRRRVCTEFKLSDRFLMKPKTKEEENLAKLELECEIQSKICNATFKLCNEVNEKNSIRKQRKLAYQQAEAKLKDLEKNLSSQRQKVDSLRKQRQRRPTSVEDLGDTSSHSTSDSFETRSQLSLNEIIASNKRLASNVKKRKCKSAQSKLISASSAPSSPIKMMEKKHPREISSPPPGSSFVPISPAMKHMNKIQPIRPSSASITRTLDEVNSRQTANLGHDPLSYGIKNRLSRSSEFSAINTYKRYSVSSESASSFVNSVFGGPCDNHNLSQYTEVFDDEENNEFESFVGVDESNSYNRPTQRSSVAFIDDEHFYLSKQLRNEMSLMPRSTLPTKASGQLSRRNSLDNSRRKSYISATQVSIDPSPFNFHHEHYLNHHPSSKYIRNTFPKKPPPPIPFTSQRPLPPSPSVTMASSASMSDMPITYEVDSNVVPFSQNVGAPVDIGLKGVRSTIIRIPLTISTSTSSHNSSFMNNKLPTPSPTPSLPPRTPTSFSRSSSARQTPTFGHSVRAKVWKETSLDSPPTPKRMSPTHSEYSPEVQVEYSNDEVDKSRNMLSKFISSNIISGGSSHGSAQRNQSSVFSTPRPQSIPLSPTLPPPGQGVEVNVLAVGHYQPYWEETKPYELSDFYKYSTKHRKQNSTSPTPKKATETKNDNSEYICTNATTDNAFENNDTNPNSGPISPTAFTDVNSSLNESLLEQLTVSDTFYDEMITWYEGKEKAKKATLV